MTAYGTLNLFRVISGDAGLCSEWEHLQTVVRVQSVKRDLETNEVLEQEDRYFLSSLARDALTDEQWLRLVRNHWWVRKVVAASVA